MILEVRPSRNGLGVFTLCSIPNNSVIFDWSNAKQYKANELPDPYVEDEYLQVAENLYIGPDGPKEPADFINHSCEPNCFVKVALPSILLVALRNISLGEELAYDYAVTMHNDSWTMTCNCGSNKCRGIIKE